MAEPDYLAQTGERMTQDESIAWVQARRDESLEKGCIFWRVSWHRDPELLLVEGWVVQPEDQGEPRFQFQATP